MKEGKNMKYVVMVLVVIGLAMSFMSRGDSKNLVSYEELQQKLNDKAPIVLLDVRTQEEFANGHIPGALLLPYDEIDQNASQLLPEKEKEIIIYCRSGRRSAIAKDSLEALGYTNVKDFGGMNRWQGKVEK